MKSAIRYSGWLGLLALMLTPCAFAHNTSAKAANGSVHSNGSDKQGDDWGGGGGGWGGGGGGWGGGGGGWGGGGGGTAVPEGGSPLVYLSVAGLCCAGALAARRR
jgi:hypothetical protein